MVKTYKTEATTVIQIDMPNGTKSIYFETGFLGIGSLRGGVYTTDDKDVQKGIESHERFNSEFSDRIWTDDIEEQEPIAETVVEQVKRGGRKKKEA